MLKNSYKGMSSKQKFKQNWTFIFSFFALIKNMYTRSKKSESNNYFDLTQRLFIYYSSSQESPNLA